MTGSAISDTGTREKHSYGAVGVLSRQLLRSPGCYNKMLSVYHPNFLPVVYLSIQNPIYLAIFCHYVPSVAGSWRLHICLLPDRNRVIHYIEIISWIQIRGTETLNVYVSESSLMYSSFFVVNVNTVRTYGEVKQVF